MKVAEFIEDDQVDIQFLFGFGRAPDSDTVDEGAGGATGFTNFVDWRLDQRNQLAEVTLRVEHSVRLGGRASAATELMQRAKEKAQEAFRQRQPAPLQPDHTETQTENNDDHADTNR